MDRSETVVPNEDELLMELSEFEIKDGDYQVCRLHLFIWWSCCVCLFTLKPNSYAHITHAGTCVYQVVVHIIEARELKAENLDGTSDPVVYVECFGQKQNTICVKSVRTFLLSLLFSAVAYCIMQVSNNENMLHAPISLLLSR